MIAEHARRHVDHVILVERQADLMQRASLVNQARVHQGYHYPRSLTTALRARVSFPRFVEMFGDCIDDTFDKYYAIARRFSKVTARQFQQLCRRIGAPLEAPPREVERLFNADTIEAVFRVQEYAFDAVRLKARMEDALERAGVDVRRQTSVTRLQRSDHGIRLTCHSATEPLTIDAARVFNCTYSQINQLLSASGLPRIGLKHEITEMALVEVPEELKRLGITVMCGPFFSCMPYPSRGLHTLSHVRYTPHQSWTDGDADANPQARLDRFARESSFSRMQRDAARYLPLMQQCRQADSLWEVKTVLTASEADDSRPILFAVSDEFPKLASIMAAKIDNVFDALDEIDLRYFRRKEPPCPLPHVLSPSWPSYAMTPASKSL
jgi:glycine/D-amino acid oxidase-like deaminating enzyme